MERLWIRIFALSAICLLIAAKTANADKGEGVFIEAGVLGSVDLNIDDNPAALDPGPGAHAAIGYNFGVVALRPSFFYTSMGIENNPNVNMDLIGGSFDVKIIPLGGHDDVNFQPYLLLGAGGAMIEPDLEGDFEGDPGFIGNAGVGFDVYLGDHFTLGAETGIRPAVFFESAGSDTYDLYLYTFTGKVGVHF